MDHPFDLDRRRIPAFVCFGQLCCPQFIVSFRQYFFTFADADVAFIVLLQRFSDRRRQLFKAVLRLAYDLEIHGRRWAAKRCPRIVVDPVQRHVDNFWRWLFPRFQNVGSPPDSVSTHRVIYVDNV